MTIQHLSDTHARVYPFHDGGPYVEVVFNRGRFWVGCPHRHQTPDNARIFAQAFLVAADLAEEMRAAHRRKKEVSAP